MFFTPGARPLSTRSVEKPFRASVRAAAEPAGAAPPDDREGVREAAERLHAEALRIQALEEFARETLVRLRTPLPRKVQEALRARAHGLLELLLDVHEDLGPEEAVAVAEEANHPALGVDIHEPEVNLADLLGGGGGGGPAP